MIPIDPTRNLIQVNSKASSLECLSITRLEHLPNEVLCCILSYFDARQLFDSFSDLNSRFNGLLSSLSPCHLHVEAKTNIDAILAFVSNITSIDVKEDCKSFRFDPFHNTLRSLTLDRLTEKHIGELYKFVRLKRLTIRGIDLSTEFFRAFNQFLMSSSHLSHLVIPTICFFNSLVGLYSLRIYYGRVFDNGFSDVIINTPNVICLDVNIPRIHLCEKTNGHLLETHHRLRHLCLRLPVGFTRDQFDFYLTHVPNIESFYIFTRSCLVFHNQMGPYDILNCLATIVENRLLNLRKFSCTTIFSMSSLNDVFDRNQIYSFFHQKFSVKLGRNIQQIDSKWIKN